MLKQQWWKWKTYVCEWPQRIWTGVKRSQESQLFLTCATEWIKTQNFGTLLLPATKFGFFTATWKEMTNKTPQSPRKNKTLTNQKSYAGFIWSQKDSNGWISTTKCVGKPAILYYNFNNIKWNEKKRDLWRRCSLLHQNIWSAHKAFLVFLCLA